MHPPISAHTTILQLVFDIANKSHDPTSCILISPHSDHDKLGIISDITPNYATSSLELLLVSASGKDNHRACLNIRLLHCSHLRIHSSLLHLGSVPFKGIRRQSQA